MIEVNSLTKNYGDRKAIDNLNFKIAKGEVVGFLGPNGAGKSTTMKIITGFMSPSSGVAKVAGFDVFEFPLEVKKRVGYLPETPPVYGDMLVEDYLHFVAELKMVPKKQRRASVEAALEKTHLTSVKRRLIQNLSKGFRQRVGIAQAIVSNPEVLILDEPTVGLDPKQVHEIRELITELRGEHTIILSTHILPEVEAMCERIIIIHQGKIVAESRIEDLSRTLVGARKMKLELLRPDRAKLEKLKGLNFVSGVQFTFAEGAGKTHVDVEVKGADEEIENLIKEVVQLDMGLTAVQSSAQLEDVFLKLTYGNNNQAEA